MPISIQVGGEVFQLSPGAVSAILSAVEETAQDGLERGFLLCQRDGTLDGGRRCVGTECSLRLSDCEGRLGGDFHTHPGDTPASGTDYLNALNNAIRDRQPRYLTCLGTPSGLSCRHLLRLPSEPDLEELGQQMRGEYLQRLKGLKTAERSFSAPAEVAYWELASALEAIQSAPQG